MRAAVFLLLVCAASAQHLYPCADPSLAALKFCDSSLGHAARAADLLERLTPAEKVSQLVTLAAAVPRLGMVEINMGSEALHGVWSGCVNGRCPTQFPSPLAMGASFDEDMWGAVGAATAREARALYHSGSPSARGLEGKIGLTYYAPAINILRDPRWGRAEEVPSEDPVVNGQLGAAFVRGMHSGAPPGEAPLTDQYWASAAVAKCLAAYSLECALLDDPYRGCVGDNYLGDRHHFDAQVSERDLRETYLPAFRYMSEAGAAGIMCAYNSINGIPACANGRLIQTVLREEYGFEGFIASDCGAVEQIGPPWHNFTDSLGGAVVSAIKAGVDSTCGTEFTNETSGVLAAIARGELTMRHLDQMAGRVLLVRFKIGLFDSPERVPFQLWSLRDSVDTAEHRALALRAAREAVVLLRNDGDGLPLKQDKRNIVVIGPQGNATRWPALACVARAQCTNSRRHACHMQRS